MPDQPDLKLVTDQALDDVGPYKFERRQRPRWSTSGRVTVLQYGRDEDRDAARRIGSLQLRDMSSHGVGAWSDEPIETGTKIGVFFPPHGPEKGFDLFGKVVRCASTDQGYSIGVQLDVQATSAA